MSKIDAEIAAKFSVCVLKHIPIEEFSSTDDRIIARLKIPKKAQTIIDIIHEHAGKELNRAELESELFSFLIISGITKIAEFINDY